VNREVLVQFHWVIKVLSTLAVTTAHSAVLLEAVDLHMLLGVTCLRKRAFTTFERAMEGFFLGVSPHMIEEILPFRALFPALRLQTHEQHLPPTRVFFAIVDGNKVPRTRDVEVSLEL
jgi:hypothetical protein